MRRKTAEKQTHIRVYLIDKQLFDQYAKRSGVNGQAEAFRRLVRR